MNKHGVAASLLGMRGLKLDVSKDLQRFLKKSWRTKVQKVEGGKYARFGPGGRYTMGVRELPGF